MALAVTLEAVLNNRGSEKVIVVVNNGGNSPFYSN